MNTHMRWGGRVLAAGAAALLGLPSAWAGPDGRMVTRNFEQLPTAMKGQGFYPVSKVADDVYPAALRRAGIEGSATVRVYVSLTGKLENVEVAKSSGDSRIDTAAVQFAKAMQYKTMSPNGVPSAWTDEVPLTFKVADSTTRSTWSGVKLIRGRPREWTAGS